MSGPKRPSVLIVDDFPDSATSLALCLTIRGYDARAATSGPEALTLLDGWVPDVAVLDLGMPGMDGYELAEQVCKVLPRRPVLVAVTGFAAPAERARSLAFGFANHFAKPVDPSHIDAMLRSVEKGDELMVQSTMT